MGIQTGSVSMICLGVDNHPTFQTGIHLRWTMRPELGLPPLGFDIFRRFHRLGIAAGFDFTRQPIQNIQMLAQFGPTVWTTTDTMATPEIMWHLRLLSRTIIYKNFFSPKPGDLTNHLHDKWMTRT